MRDLLKRAEPFVRVWEFDGKFGRAKEQTALLAEIAAALATADETPVPTSNDLLALLRFRVLDYRNATEEARERLMLRAADEIEWLRAELGWAQSVVEQQRASDETAATHWHCAEHSMIGTAACPVCREAADKSAAALCVACEGKPRWPNEPCAVCGASSGASDAL